MSRSPLFASFLIVVGAFASPRSHAEPYLAVQQGYNCNSCHVNATGGGLRNDFGIIFAENVLPARTLENINSLWSGKLADFLRLGGDLRTNWTRNAVPNASTQQKFAVDQLRLYADVAVIPNRVGIYIDELVAPNSPENLEAYLRYGSPVHGWYFKGGRFYLPF